MRRRAALLLAALLGSCAAPEIDLPEEGPAAAAPHAAPAPSPRGVAPAPSPASARTLAAGLGPVGPVCGDPRLLGARLPPVVGSQPGCGIAEPVALVSVAGVALTGDVRIGCETARALADWMETGARPAALRTTGAALVSAKPAASYVCRARNRQKGAPLSEHARGNAIDISEFTLADGRTVDVLSGWRRGDSRSFLRAAWRAACGPFGTVLGPDSDRFHRDHIHLDVARHGNGDYCR